MTDLGRANDANAAIHTARLAFMRWSNNNLSDRLAALARVAERLTLDRNELIETIHSETAKPRDWAEAEVDFCIGSFQAHRAEFEKAWRTEAIREANTVSEVYYRPLGVVVVFSPFNSALECLQLGLLPALAAGNAVIVKSSELAMQTAARFVSAFQSELGDVVQVIHGSAEEGDALVRGAIDMVVFTGSEAVGRQIAATAGQGLKRVVLELGGKDPLIVLDDANLDDAVAFAEGMAFGFAGQVCTASEQVWVHRSLTSSFSAALVAKLKEQPRSCWPRLINEKARSRALDLIEDAAAKGATIEFGGRPADTDGRALEPTIVSGLTADMRLFHEEIFAPILCLHSFESDSELFSKLSNSRFALGATLFTADTERGVALARHLPNAMIGINRGCIGVQGTPWLGCRASGLGFLGSVEGHRQFVSRQVITRAER